jgi:hypothetical protein
MPAKVMPSDSSDPNRSSDRFSPVQDKDTRIPKLKDRVKSLGSQNTADAEDWRYRRIIEIEDLEVAWEKKLEEEYDEEVEE